MNRLSSKVVAVSFSLALLLLCGVGVISYISFLRLMQEKHWVIHTQQVLETSDHLYIYLRNAETAHSSYIFTRQLKYKEIYEQEKRKVSQQIQIIRNLTRDNFKQQEQIQQLELKITQKIHFLETSIKILQQKSFAINIEFAKSNQTININIDNQINNIKQVIEREEKNLLKRRIANTDEGVIQIIFLVFLGYGLSAVLIVGVYLLLQKQIQINQVLSAEAIFLEQQAAKAKLVNLLETVTDAFVALDENWCYTYVNQRAGQIFNRRPEDLIGKNIWEEFPEGVGQKFYDAYYQAVSEQKVIEIEEYYPPWDRWFENRIYPSQEGLSIFFQDITRRKLAELALEKSEKRYRSLVLATSQAVWFTDAQGFPQEYSSWIALTGQTQEEIQVWGWLNAIHPEDREFSQFLWNQAREWKSPYKLEHRVRVADGSYRFFAVRGVPILDADNQIQEWIGTHTDITDRKLAEEGLQQAKAELEVKVQERTAELEKLNEELRNSNQELEQFAYVASHDLQEPLRAVTGYSQLLVEEYRERLDDSAQEYIDYIIDGARRMQQLIKDLLAYSRIGTRGRIFTLTDCNLVLSEALSNLQVAIAESQAVITYELLPNLLADKTQLIQLFQNLIGNAIKFRRQDVPPRIHISAARVDKSRGVEVQGWKGVGEEDLTHNHQIWLFSVQDNGIGIKSQYLNRIFEVFRRLHTRREFSGTGIGLAICKKIVERHNGHIWAESQLGVGTTFYFTLHESAIPESLNKDV
ncbi:PAS domain S-box protein [Aulosira sp. FACHB-615]|uniref:PAS domain S-box protein n=1 Tax=Aulosira sp. FACHB-615 TaxID=2692777 RepID=UPI001687B66E|nr:PAS domain S-box protein [Aulosira sp. FACHB-615]MBD2492500.1 PAS domain S-box protein [Aulosira sp. FACHB-615]